MYVSLSLFFTTLLFRIDDHSHGDLATIGSDFGNNKKTPTTRRIGRSGKSWEQRGGGAGNPPDVEGRARLFLAMSDATPHPTLLPSDLSATFSTTAAGHALSPLNLASDPNCSTKIHESSHRLRWESCDLNRIPHATQAKSRLPRMESTPSTWRIRLMRLVMSSGLVKTKSKPQRAWSSSLPSGAKPVIKATQGGGSSRRA